MDAYLQKGDTLCGDFMAKVMANALKMGCNNACMKRIVAAPTAGACGVLPAVLVTYYREYDVPDEKMIEAMYVAAGIRTDYCTAEPGISGGASGGCQAGRSVLAPVWRLGAICYIRGGDTGRIGDCLRDGGDKME